MKGSRDASHFSLHDEYADSRSLAEPAQDGSNLIADVSSAFTSFEEGREVDEEGEKELLEWFRKIRI